MEEEIFATDEAEAIRTPQKPTASSPLLAPDTPPFESLINGPLETIKASSLCFSLASAQQVISKLVASLLDS